MAVEPRVVDVHTHLYPRSYLDRLATRRSVPKLVRRGDDELFLIFPGESGRPIDRSYWSLESKLVYMEHSGISQSVVSLGNPWLEPFVPDEGLALARVLNQEFASYSARTDGRVVGMACIPNGRVRDVVTVVTESASTAGLHGVVSGTKICGFGFDDRSLDPVWSVLAETGAPLLVHPHYGVGIDEMDGFGHALPLALGFPFETTIALARLAMSGVFERFPGLRVVGSHGGGTIPFLAGRLDGCWRPDGVARQRNGIEPTSSLAGLYLDSLVYHPRALSAVSDLVGTRQMVFGTDHPFAISDPGSNIDAVKDTFQPEHVREMLATNAATIFDLPAVSRP